MYTYVGQTLIAVNPFVTIKDLYSEDTLKHYCDQFVID